MKIGSMIMKPKYIVPLLLLIAINLLMPISTSKVYADNDIEYYAVIIGISNYTYLNDLAYSDDDAREINEELSETINSDNIKLLVDSSATKAAISEAINVWLPSISDSNDIIIIYYSGHGGTIDNTFYITPCDSYLTSYENDISDSELTSWLLNIASNNIVVILDTCESGSIINTIYLPSRIIITSCGSNEVSYDDSSLRNGTFTYYFLDGFNKVNSVDINNDDIITLQELFNYANPLTTQWEAKYSNPQHPIYYSNIDIPIFSMLTINTNINAGTLNYNGVKYYPNRYPDSKKINPYFISNLVLPDIVNANSNKRYVFQSWDDGLTSCNRTIIGGGIYNANYITQYYFTVNSLYDISEGEGWYDKDTSATTNFATQEISEGTNIKHIFQYWELDDDIYYDLMLSVNMDTWHTATTIYRDMYYLDVLSNYGITEGTGWYYSNTMAEISVTNSEGILIRHIFDGWTGDYICDYNESNLYVDSPKTIVAKWRTDYTYLYMLIGGISILLVIILTTIILYRKKH